MTHPGSSRAFDLRSWLIWTAGFLAFPIAGVAGRAVPAGPGGLARRRGQPRRPAPSCSMQYQFAEPFIVDSSKITTKLGIRATPIGQALEHTLNSYRGT